MKVAERDIVRIKKTGEVATVSGWARHPKLGSVLNVRVSATDDRTLPVAELEFVASAKCEPRGFKTAVWVFGLVLVLAMGAYLGFLFVHQYGVPVTWTVLTVPLVTLAWFEAYLRAFVRPKKTRVS